MSDGAAGERGRAAGRGAGERAGGGDGVLLVDKPAGVTSHDVVASIRRSLPRGVKVGHAGTLDPFATGLLLVLIGRATRAQRWLMGLPKRYEAVARFGYVSSTGDPEGEIVATGVIPDGDLALPVGAIWQRPPAFSAVKVGGRRAYALARAGTPVELAERQVHVSVFDELWRDGERRGFAIECSSGTYVRSLIADLGDAYCEQLRRTRIGQFDVAAASDRLIPLAEALQFMPAVTVDEDTGRRAANGGRITLAAAGTEAAGAAAAGAAAAGAGQTVRVLDPAGLVCLAEVDVAEDGAVVLRPRVGFRG